MATPAYTTRLFLGVVRAGNIASAGSVPAGYRWIIRDIETLQNNSSNGRVQLIRGGGGENLAGVDGTTGPLVKHWEGRVALHSGEELQIYVQGADANVCVSGYVLTENPE